MLTEKKELIALSSMQEEEANDYINQDWNFLIKGHSNNM
jgi:hypothetical protein